ncbi:hypothetical protein GCM10029992_42890 [Glycomyces albus]
MFCANDDMAIGLVRALTEAGRTVPGDVSVVGFDDVPSAAYLNPPLTTVRQDFESHAIRGLDLLLQHMEGRRPAPRDFGRRRTRTAPDRPRLDGATPSPSATKRLERTHRE